MHGEADWPRENARTHARTAQLVCTRACTVVRAYLWISIQWWCLLEIPRRFPPSTPAPCFSSVPENRDALLLEAPCRKPCSNLSPPIVRAASFSSSLRNRVSDRNIDLVFASHFYTTDFLSDGSC